jgi:hypothetical protein
MRGSDNFVELTADPLALVVRFGECAHPIKRLYDLLAIPPAKDFSGAL